MIYNKVLNYKEICKILSDEPTYSGKSRNLQLNRWNKNYKINKIGRGKYIIERERTQEEKESFNKENYNNRLKYFEKERHIKILNDLTKPIGCNDIIQYICDFHPDTIQTATAFNLLHSIGCSLCHYPMGRFEVMLYLGLSNALHRVQIDETEFDIYLPKLDILIEIDGYFYHAVNPKEKDRENKKFAVANAHNLKLIKIIEQQQHDKMYIKDNKIYINPYGTATKEERKQIIKLIQQVLPYKHSKELWNLAAKYMRDWKASHN